MLLSKRKFKRKFDFCFSLRNSVFLHGTLNETSAAQNFGTLPGTP